MAHLQSDRREFIELLSSLKVEYLVVGGHAVAFHGHPRFTGDIDFFIRTTHKNAARMLRVLDDLPRMQSRCLGQPKGTIA